MVKVGNGGCTGDVAKNSLSMPLFFAFLRESKIIPFVISCNVLREEEFFIRASCLAISSSVTVSSCALFFVAVKETDKGADKGADTGADTGARLGVGADTGVGVGADTGVGIGVGVGAGADIGVGVGASTGVGTTTADFDSSLVVVVDLKALYTLSNCEIGILRSSSVSYTSTNFCPKPLICFSLPIFLCKTSSLSAWGAGACIDTCTGISCCWYCGWYI
jgi:hypothetical protein